MLRLFVHIKDQRLKVREATPDEDFPAPIKWGNLEFVYSETANFMMLWSSLLPEISSDKGRALIKLQGDRYPVSPHYHELKNLCPLLAFGESSDEWVFFGGTFNPWHKGHQAALDLLPEDKTCFVLPDINPFKPLRDFDLTASILELSVNIHFRKNQFLVPTFLVENIKNPTVTWMERLKKDFPDKRLSLLLGFDSFAAITTWTRYKDLLPLLECIYVISRLETDHMREVEREKVSETQVVYLGRHEFEKLSSTELRKK